MKEAPQYRKLYEQLRKLIEDGVYVKGDLLPSENELCTIHRLTRPTVRNSLDLLVNEGFIMRQQGKGSIVQGKPKEIGILSLTGTTKAIGKEKLETKIIVKPYIRSWDDDICFDIPEKEKVVGCIYLERIRLINEVPIIFEISMIPNINLPRFTSLNFENKSLFKILRKNYQIQIKGGEQKIHAIQANKTIQKHFDVGENHPILRLDRKLETSRIGFTFYSQLFCNTEAYSLIGRF